jgi:hypothetical protein
MWFNSLNCAYHVPCKHSGDNSVSRDIKSLSKDMSNSNATLKIITVHNCAPAPIRVLFRVAVPWLVAGGRASVRGEPLQYFCKVHLVKRNSGRSPKVHTMFRVSTQETAAFLYIELISKDTSNSNLKIITVHNCAPAPIRVLFRVAVLGLVRSWCKIKKSEKMHETQLFGLLSSCSLTT